ncbi:MAG: DUF1320 domain-containing protein [Thiothrix sp.]|nr:DUF1320 domain-containing protein [Thiothrix sp.]HPQ94782.1 DUF1320 domain-containing protein [Thiolinea sp.]
MYCTQLDIAERIGQQELLQLTDRSRTGQVDSVAVERAIADAGAEMDGYLAGRYVLPFDPAPPLLVRIAVDIAVYQLFSVRRGGGMVEDVRHRYRDAVKLLEGIAAGRIQLGQVPEPAVVEDDIVMRSAPGDWSRAAATEADA